MLYIVSKAVLRFSGTPWKKSSFNLVHTGV
jgi:hypothetical protein